MMRKRSETPSPHIEEYLYICVPFTDRGCITLIIPLPKVPTEEVLEVFGVDLS